MTRHPKGDRTGYRCFVCGTCGAWRFMQMQRAQEPEPDPPTCNWCAANIGPAKKEAIG